AGSPLPTAGRRAAPWPRPDASLRSRTPPRRSTPAQVPRLHGALREDTEPGTTPKAECRRRVIAHEIDVCEELRREVGGLVLPDLAQTEPLPRAAQTQTSWRTCQEVGPS